MKRFFNFVGVFVLCLTFGPVLFVAGVLLFAGLAVASIGVIPAALWVQDLKHKVKDGEKIVKHVQRTQRTPANN